MDRLAWAVNLCWFLVGCACGFSDLWFTIIYLWKSLWYTACESERRTRRHIGYLGGLLLCAAAVVFIGVFC